MQICISDFSFLLKMMNKSVVNILFVGSRHANNDDARIPKKECLDTRFCTSMVKYMPKLWMATNKVNGLRHWSTLSFIRRQEMHYGRELMQYSMVHDILNILTNRVCLGNFIFMPRIYLQSHNSKLPLSHQGTKISHSKHKMLQ